MLTECVFIVIIFSTYLTWHSKYLFPKREKAKSKTKVEPSQINLEYHEASIKKRIKTISKVKSWHVFCAWTLTLQPRPLLFCPPHVHLLQRQEPVLFHFLPRQQLRFFGFQLRFLRAFGDFSNGLVSLLSALVEDEDASFLRWSSLWPRSGFLVSLGRSLACSSSSLSFPALAVVATLFLCK